MSVSAAGPCGGGGGFVSCWSCRGPVAAHVMHCPTCGAMQSLAGVDAFRLLGCGRGYRLNLENLEKAYLALQQVLHPDRFARRGGRERLLAAANAATVNEAYETLRDPVKRAFLLLRLAGAVAPCDDARGGEGTVDDAGLLEEAMRGREALLSADGAEALASLVARNEADMKECRETLAQSWESGDYSVMKAEALRLRYLAKLAAEIRQRRVAVF